MGFLKDFRKICGFSLVFLVLSIGLISLVVIDVAFASPTDFVDDAQPGFYLEYEEVILISWSDRGWENLKAGEATRRVTVASVSDSDFTVREDLSYIMFLKSGLDYGFVDVEFLDGNREELDGGNASLLGSSVATAIHAYYKVEKGTGKVLKYLSGGVGDEEESALQSEIPLELEHYWGYFDASGNEEEYCWDVVGFPYVDSIWEYAVKPDLGMGEKIDDKWTARADFGFGFEGQVQDCVNVTGSWKDESNDEVLADWYSERWCDIDTGLKLGQVWKGNCSLQVYDYGLVEWSLREGFSVNVGQTLVHTSFSLLDRGVPRVINIVSPEQSALVADKITVKVYVVNFLDDTDISAITYYAKSAASDNWTNVGGDWRGYQNKSWVGELELDVSSWSGKWQIMVADSNGEYFDIVDVFLKPVYVDSIDTERLGQLTYGPHSSGGLDRIPYEVSFKLRVRDSLVGDLSVLVDCWYVPMTGSFWSEDLGETVNLKDYWGGDPAYQSLFEGLYGEKSSAVDPKIGSLRLSYDTFSDEHRMLHFVKGGSYSTHGYNYTVSNGGVQRSNGTIGNNQASSLFLGKGDVVSVSGGLFFENPGNSSGPKMRLYSFEVIADYSASLDGAIESFTEHAHKTIAVKRVTPTSTPSERVGKAISAAFEPEVTIGHFIEQTFGAQYAEAAYQGNYVHYLYYLATGIDTTIRYAPIAISVYGILTGGPVLAAVGSFSLLSGIPIPTSYADLVLELSSRTYGAVPKEDRIMIWYGLLQYGLGVTETKIVDPTPLVSWGNVISKSASGDLLNTTVSLDVQTWNKTETEYYLNFTLRNRGDYPARFIKVHVVGESEYKPWTEHVLPDDGSEYRSIEAGNGWGVYDMYIGSEKGDWRVDVYFISDAGGSSPPVCSLSGNNVAVHEEDGNVEVFRRTGSYTQFELPVISQAVVAFSPVNLHLYDKNGRHVGLSDGGDVDLGIPECWYSGEDSEPEFAVLSGDSDEIRVEVEGTADGYYGLAFAKHMSFEDEDGKENSALASFGLAKVKIADGEKHEYNYDFALLEDQISNLTKQGWNVDNAMYHVFSNIDSDGDGISDILDENPTQAQTELVDTDDSTLLILGIVVVAVGLVALVLFFRLRRKDKPKYKKLDQF